MKNCPGCKISVEGDFKHCPLCQNRLVGDKSESVYPSKSELKKKSILYKIQLFIVVSLAVVLLALEYIMDIKGAIHYSILTAGIAVLVEMWLVLLIKKHNNPSRVVFHNALWAMILLVYIFWMIGRIEICVDWILPSIYAVSIILHFIYTMLDKAQNALVYLLGTSIVGIIVSLIDVFIYKSNIFLWVICFLLSVISLIGIWIFKEKRLTNEFVKRFNF